MILRHVTAHLREQNWTAIGIELVILVLGVFLGMQVSNWNEEREINQKAAVFTERLTDDLRKEAWGYEYLIAYMRDVNKNQRQVLDAMAGDISMSDEQFVISAYRATQYKYNDRFRATYDELVSTGTISLIADQQLRETAISMFTTALLNVIEQEGRESEYRHLFRASMSAEIQEALLVRCGDRFASVLDYTTIEGAIDYPCTLDVPSGKIKVAASALRALPGLVPALQVRFADTQTGLTDLQQGSYELLKSLKSIRNAKP